MAHSMRSAPPLADMNITPLVDVMLVMLVIFMLALPVISNTQVLNVGDSIDEPTLPMEPVRLRVEASGVVHWNGEPVALAEVQRRLDAAGAASVGADGRADPARQPAVHLDVDAAADYALAAQVMARVDRAGLAKLSLTNAR
jgi:biopolymer transport protein ExbD